MSNDVIEEVIDGRESVYGNPVTTFPRVAQIWSGIVGHEITAEQAVLMLIGYKTLRASMTPDYSDNTDDIEGYLDIFRQLIGDKMIHARSVTEYLEEKEMRKTVRIERVESEPGHSMRPSLDVAESGAVWLCSVCDWVGRGDRVTAKELFLQHHGYEEA